MEFCAYSILSKITFRLNELSFNCAASMYFAHNKILVCRLRHMFRRRGLFVRCSTFFRSACTRKRRNFPEEKRRGTGLARGAACLYFSINPSEFSFLPRSSWIREREMIASFRGCHAMEDRPNGRRITSSRERPFCQFGHAAPSCKRDTIAIIYAALSTTGI